MDIDSIEEPREPEAVKPQQPTNKQNSLQATRDNTILPADLPRSAAIQETLEEAASRLTTAVSKYLEMLLSGHGLENRALLEMPFACYQASALTSTCTGAVQVSA